MSLENCYTDWDYNQLLKDNQFLLEQIDGVNYHVSINSRCLLVRAKTWEGAKRGAAMFIELRKLGVSNDLAFILMDGFIEQTELLELVP